MKISFIPYLIIGSVIMLSSAFAQEKSISIGARGGLSIPKIQATGDNPMSKGYKSKVAAGAGIFAEFHITKCFSIRPMIEYSGQGGKRDGMQAIPQRMLAPMFEQIPPAFLPTVKENLPEYLYANFQSTTSFNYLMVPVLAQFGWNLKPSSPYRVYVSGGPFISFLLSAHQETSGTSSIYVNNTGTVTLDQALSAAMGMPIAIGPKPFDRNDDIKDQMHKINAGLTGYAGISYTTQRHTIFLEGGGSYGFVKLQKEAVNGQNRIGVGNVMFGYSYRLGK